MYMYMDIYCVWILYSLIYRIEAEIVPCKSPPHRDISSTQTQDQDGSKPEYNRNPHAPLLTSEMFRLYYIL